LKKSVVPFAQRNRQRFNKKDHVLWMSIIMIFGSANVVFFFLKFNIRFLILSYYYYYYYYFGGQFSDVAKVTIIPRRF